MGVKRGEKERGEKGEAGERSFEVAADSFTFRNEIVVLPSLLIRLLSSSTPRTRGLFSCRVPLRAHAYHYFTSVFTSSKCGSKFECARTPLL